MGLVNPQTFMKDKKLFTSKQEIEKLFVVFYRCSVRGGLGPFCSKPVLKHMLKRFISSYSAEKAANVHG